MKDDVVADTSFYICNLCNLKRKDRLLKYLELYQFHAGEIILDTELATVLNAISGVREKITKHKGEFAKLFKLRDYTTRTPEHVCNDGEYEAIGIAIMLARIGSLHCLILDDDGPKKFAKKEFKDLRDKVHGTVGFIKNSYVEDHLISKDMVLEHLKDIQQSFITYQKNGSVGHRPCSMDQNFVNTVLVPLINELEYTA